MIDKEMTDDELIAAWRRGELVATAPTEEMTKRLMVALVVSEWDRVRLVLEGHQKVGNQIAGRCSCGFVGDAPPDHLDHLTDQLCGVSDDDAVVDDGV